MACTIGVIFHVQFLFLSTSFVCYIMNLEFLQHWPKLSNELMNWVEFLNNFIYKMWNDLKANWWFALTFIKLNSFSPKQNTTALKCCFNIIHCSRFSIHGPDHSSWMYDTSYISPHWDPKFFWMLFFYLNLKFSRI